jgi:predicted nucleic acid-binding protein
MKLVTVESHSAALSRWLETELSSALSMVSCDLLRTEARRAALRSGDTAAHSRALERLERVTLFPVSPGVFDDAGIVEPRTLRSLDAIHLVAAASLGDDLEGIVTYDRRLIEAAAAHGIPTVSPGT